LLLDEVNGIEESAVIGLPHKDFGEAVTAIIVADKNLTLPGTDELISKMKQHLAAYKVPKKIIVVTELPRNTMGKVQKNILRETYASLYN
jgi:malonyl-CoA/methylmalonyl-CoA synthetase